MKKISGKVYLVGAGPGDPGLLTLRGYELLQRADVVVYDSLVNEAILQFAPQAEYIYVGKRPDAHPLPQDEINRLLLEQAARHACVVRLKGGDPFVFGRGGEEAAALANSDVPFEIVPGVTAGIGAAAYAGIPVTHRGTSASVTFVTGHRRDSEAPAAALDRLHLEGTLVFYMGVSRMEENLKALIDQGRPGDTPAAAIEWGTWAKQRVIEGTLATLARRAQNAKLESPSLVVVGDVIEMRKTIAWFENRPLYGRRVCVTRARRRAPELVHLLHERGADVFELPTVQVERHESPSLDTLGSFDWIVFTSVNGVESLFEQMNEAGLDARALHQTKLCAISAKTAEALEHRALRVDLVPPKYESEVVVAALEKLGGALSDQRILMPRADIGRSSLPKALRKAGAEVVELQSYKTVVPPNVETLVDELMEFQPDYIIFTSGSAAQHFAQLLQGPQLERLRRTASFAAIGPIAAAEAEKHGMPPEVIPDVHRVPALVDAIAEHDARIRQTQWPDKEHLRGHAG